MQDTNTFETIQTLPDPVAQEKYVGLVGIGHIKSRLEKEAAVMLNPSGLADWSTRFYKKEIELVKVFQRRPPLFILSGDVGTGKTAFAESFADQVARQENIEITLYKLSLNARGSGIVGEITKLISDSFERLRKDALEHSGGKHALVLLIDEADALAQSREAAQMHHEDKAGVNALIRGIDSIQNLPIPVLVVMCTNRYAAIDPAVRRRAAATFTFNRPSKEQCVALFMQYLADAGMTEGHAQLLADKCVPYEGLEYGYTYSDLTQRVLPTVLLNVYPERLIDFADIEAAIKDIPPTAPFNEYAEQREQV
jgi:SpoVK/Ycf46/Vps4 family AAA+-type ATPase